jgi:DNA-directed RNA polymerase subunit beta
MSDLRAGKINIRKSFGKIKDLVPVPDLIAIQSSSFNDFVQLDYLPEERKLMGLEKALKDIFPIDYEDKMSLEYVSYELGHWACNCGELVGIAHRYRWQCSSCNASDCSRLIGDAQCPKCKKNTARYVTCPHCLSRVVVQMPMTLAECRSSEQTFSMPLKVKIQLITWAKDHAGNRVVRDAKEQSIFFADLPVMADLYEEDGRFKLGSLGTFLISGVDRVIVSQLHRSPGVIFAQSKKTKDYRGRPYYLARIIPMRGSWIDFEFDSNDYLYVRIDKKKKVPVTTFLQAFGIPREEIISHFYSFDQIQVKNGDFFKNIDSSIIGQRIERDMLPEKLEEIYLGKRITQDILDNLEQAGVKNLPLRKASLLNRVFGRDVVDPKTGELLVEQGQTFNEEHYELFKKFSALTFELVHTSGYVQQPTIAVTLTQDKAFSQDEALKEIHTKMWPGDASSLKEIKERLEGIFYNPRLYDLTVVGRVRMNKKLGLSIPEDVTVLTKDDILATIRYMVNLREQGEGELDDIDHLGNRRVRLVGELLTTQIYVGLTRIERIVRERFRSQDLHGALMPQDFLNVRPLSIVLREFFGLGQLSQPVDQTNPLSEIAHKRRLSALGPGGVMKDRATLEVRDVHTSHYGRICPIETPEGQTIGLISSLSTYAMVNDLGFIETGYCPIVNKEIQDRVEFLDAFEEADCYIAQSDAVDPKTGKLRDDKVLVRHQGNYIYVDADQVNYVDLSPKQLVSVSSALIPFLEHDDAVRALMGSNMQRQAVPIIRPQVPRVATGMEEFIVKASGSITTAVRNGVVEYVSAEKIVVRADKDQFKDIDDWMSRGIDVYVLRKFEGSSYSTWIHQTPIVHVGDKVSVGDALTNGAAVVNGELALGTNLLVAFMPWHGYNFEDAIVLSKRLVAEDLLTSVHIDEYDVDARETKLGPEEITRDIPNVSAAMLESLDEDGIVRIGTRVKPGDILVGKVTLKGDIQYSPEEKLLRAIFGEKSREVRDTSLRVPPGTEGTVIDVKVFSRSGIRKDKRYREEINKQANKIEADFDARISFLQNMLADQIIEKLDGQHPGMGVSKSLLKKDVFDAHALRDKKLDELFALKAKDKEVNRFIGQIRESFERQIMALNGLKQECINKLKRRDTLPSGVIKVVKVYVAVKRPISVGDKMAGRHGNKGVVSTIVPREDMPYLDDGTSVDIVLNPLGVPSRMNVGQILETSLGLVGWKIGKDLNQKIEEQGFKSIRKELEYYVGSEIVETVESALGAEGLREFAQKIAKNGMFYQTPVFDGAQWDADIKPLLRKANLPETGTFMLRDGRTGEYFDQPVAVGSIYMMKLNHMVDDKLHARSVGPYSLVTQQPLGGKAQLGGQRLGEMEVWALEAHGAAYTLQEMLTYKSDDVAGRHKVYEAIVRGEEVPEPGVPESFNVLIKELQSLGIQVDLLKSGKEKISE